MNQGQMNINNVICISITDA